MERSAELQNLYVACCDAQSNGNVAFFEDLFSREPGVVVIGTDPTEWWTGYDTIIKIFKAQLAEIGDVQILPDTATAYRDGTVGWVAGHPTVRLSDGTEVPMRLTVVFRQEQGKWKIVQWHSSTGITNEELLGESLTT